MASLLTPHTKPGHAPNPRDFMLRPPPEREVSEAEAEASFDLLLGVAAAAPVVRAPEEG